MTTSQQSERVAQDAFESMVGETGPHPNDPQHPDPGFDVDAPVVKTKTAGQACHAGPGRTDGWAQ